MTEYHELLETVTEYITTVIHKGHEHACAEFLGLVAVYHRLSTKGAE